MNFTELYKKKGEQSTCLKEKYNLLKKNKALGLVKLQDKSILKDLRDAFVELPVNFVIEIEGANEEKIGKNIIAINKVLKRDLIAYDFIICDDSVSELNSILEKGVIPIISEKNHFGKILQQFDPMKNEGNAFLYYTSSKWGIYAALIRYLENYKFPFDNKNLIKNILKI